VAGLTQRELAALIGVNRVTVARWETNAIVIPPLVLKLFQLIEAAPEDSLAVLKNGQHVQPVEAKAKPKKVPPAPAPAKPDFGGAGPPPTRQRPMPPTQVDGKDSDAWRFGF
jgi:transcriptional regulator with XRE-family HTH domain